MCSSLVRVKEERKKSFNTKQRALTNDIALKLEKAKLDGPKEKRTELEALAEAAEALEYDDAGPQLDVVAFRDANGVWRVVVDVAETGDLSAATILADFSIERKFSTLGSNSMSNFGVKVYGDGTLISLVTDCGAHGTHVAAIAGAHFPEEPEKDGVAPGAQFISVKIADTRLHSEETGTGLVRGLIAVQRAKADVINLSFGEPVGRANYGRFPELLNETV